MLVVLDLDDTLYLERDYVVSGFSQLDVWVRATFAAKGFLEYALTLFLKGKRQHIIDESIAHLGIPSAAAPMAVAYYRNHIPSLTLPADSARFLAKCRTHHRLGLITDGRSRGQHAKIAALGLSDAFDVKVVTGDKGPGYGKPHPGSFQEAAAATQALVCIYVADNPAKDFVAPRQLGWLPSIRVRRQGSLHEQVPTPADCAEVQDLDEAWTALSTFLT